ncbi:MAG: heavy metal-binding domain-containing protein, partial [Woeseia sp.]
MNRILMIIAALVVALAIGFGLGNTWRSESGASENASENASDNERKILYWKAPMDPNYRRDAPGKSPMGMDLVPVYADEAGDDDSSVVSIDPRIVNNLGVRTAP